MTTFFSRAALALFMLGFMLVAVSGASAQQGRNMLIVYPVSFLQRMQRLHVSAVPAENHIAYLCVSDSAALVYQARLSWLGANGHYDFVEWYASSNHNGLNYCEKFTIAPERLTIGVTLTYTVTPLQVDTTRKPYRSLDGLPQD